MNPHWLIKNPALFSLLLASCYMTGSYASEEMSFGADVSIFSEENVSRGFFDIDAHQDQISSVTLDILVEHELSNRAAVFISATYTNKSYSEYSKLSVDEVGVKLDYTFQTGLRFGDPMYTLSVEITESDYGSVLRDSTTLTVGAKLLKRFTTKINAATGFSYSVREADTNVFDITTSRIFAALDYSLTQGVSLYGSYVLQDGGSVSTITTNDPDLLAQQIGYATINEADAAGALLPDDAFGGLAQSQFAYQNQASTSVLLAGVNYSLNKHNAFDFSAQTSTTKLDSGLEYENFIYVFSYLARF
jgi:hypothetical protein